MILVFYQHVFGIATRKLARNLCPRVLYSECCTYPGAMTTSTARARTSTMRIQNSACIRFQINSEIM
eukprot:COSAG02_NODE_32565_length_514_cov_0.997590_1_plen_66_part_10